MTAIITPALAPLFSCHGRGRGRGRGDSMKAEGEGSDVAAAGVMVLRSENVEVGGVSWMDIDVLLRTVVSRMSDSLDVVIVKGAALGAAGLICTDVMTTSDELVMTDV